MPKLSKPTKRRQAKNFAHTVSRQVAAAVARSGSKPAGSTKRRSIQRAAIVAAVAGLGWLVLHPKGRQLVSQQAARFKGKAAAAAPDTADAGSPTQHAAFSPATANLP